MSQVPQQKSGDACEGCKERWIKKQQPAKILQRASGVTMNHKMIVPLCPFCDGDAVAITAMGNHDDIQAA